MTEPLPICVIGAGSIGMRHIGVAQQSSHVTLGAVVEPDPARRAELAGQGLPMVGSLDDVPAETRAAVIATPTPDHLASALRAVERGWAVLVEKPICQTTAEADRLCAAAQAAGVPLITGHHRRCHPFVAAARSRLDGIGDLVAVQGIWSLRKHDKYYDTPWRRQPGAGPILTNLSHEIDLLRHLAGEITAVSALTSNAARGLEIEDTAAISFRFASGALGNFMLSDAGASPWAFEAATDENPAIAASGQDSMRLVGTRGALSFPSLTLWGGARDWRQPLLRQEGPRLPSVDPIAEQLDRFASIAGGAEDRLLASGLDGRATLAVTEAVLNAARSGRVEPVDTAPER